jgi:signal transduction histidine kinase
VRAELRDEIRGILDSKGSMSGMEIQLKKKNGEIVTVLEYSRALKDEQGTLIGFEGILEDITTRKEMEQKLNNYLNALVHSQKELERLNGEKDKLFSVLSHDLRSPFGSILGFCEVLTTDSETLTEMERNQFVRYIKEAAEDQLSLVNKLLDWSRFETGRVKMELRNLKLCTIAEKSVQNLSGLALKKRINLVSNVPDDLFVQGDEVFLRQVFDNIIGNALKFTPSGGTISVNLAEKHDSSIVVTVKDTGVGIPMENIEKLFKPEEKYTTKGLEGEKGTGLGLSVCQEIMKKHGGSLSVESEIGIGTTFTLTFVNNTPAEGLSILVVDDEEGARVLHSRYIKRAYPDATIVYASNGREAVEQALRLRPHVVITDYSMPLMDGYEVLVELKRYAETKHIPVLIITGDDSKESSESMVLSGAAAVLSKPVTPAKLKSELQRFLGEV